MDKLTVHITQNKSDLSTQVLLLCFYKGDARKIWKKASWKTCKQGECQSPIKCTNALWWIESAIKQAADNMQVVWLPK